ncbi:HPP family protein [Desulforamulus hydrothermalis]|uniref:HPP family protein+B94 n=1 Tax=Desulforamulus hydrothermalis Lam5 = DSM 18033 TaxID=1121428 RepID=K8DYX3_9FIRM|nr:HPP family protein [Desulforamulus hydrothermalis]CCO08124.1 HPP family protein+B94 [Desulforamulus hydrothermalis Lam5 = DSM 18033]SHG81460.1 HPP family protein [Desulforamulus hydrothermalis Lam5 = DSM 18033]
MDRLDAQKQRNLSFSQRALVYFQKMRGGSCPACQPVCLASHMFNAVGSFLGMGFICLLNFYYHIPLLVPSLGASAVLLFAACHVPMAQPRNVVGGHILSAAAGVLVYQLLGHRWWTIALAVTLAILLMNLSNTLHPPGGATAFVAVYTGQGVGYIFSPVALGAIILVILAALINNCSPKRKYPTFWF